MMPSSSRTLEYIMTGANCALHIELEPVGSGEGKNCLIEHAQLRSILETRSMPA